MVLYNVYHLAVAEIRWVLADVYHLAVADIRWGLNEGQSPSCTDRGVALVVLFEQVYWCGLVLFLVS